MKLAGLSNLGPKPSAPKARDARSSEKSGSSSFEETLGLNKETPAPRPVQAKVQEQPRKQNPEAKTEQKPVAKEAPKSDAKAPVKQDARHEAKRDGKQEDKRDGSGSGIGNGSGGSLGAGQGNGKLPEVKRVDGKLADAAPENGEDSSASIESVESASIPGQSVAPSLNGPVQDRVLNANSDLALNASLMKQPEVKAQDDGVDSLTRRVVWNDFLRKMKDDLGVDADDVLKAFSTLSDEELAQPPEQTVNSVVAALGLEGTQAKQATTYFNDLVTKTKSKSMGEELAASGKQINLTLMSQRDMQRKALDRSLDKMNQTFWHPPQAAAVKNPQAQAEAQLNDDMMVLGPNGLVPMSSLTGLKDMPAMNEAAPVAAPGSKMAALDKMTAAPKAGPTTEKNTVDELVRQFMSPQAKTETLKAGEMSALPMAAIPQAAPAATAQTAAPQVGAQIANSAVSLDGLKAILGDFGKGKSDSDGDDADASADKNYATNVLGATDHLKGAAVKGAEFQSELAKAGAPQVVTVPELVDKAQIMLHDGGGEMKVTMSPDGLGEVAMRVSVTDGKVQVQMITESDEAKKMIERHVGELKGQLAQNNLHVENIKIDTATNLGKQLEQQYNDAQRQMAHQSMEQFRQDQQGWRRSFFDVGSARQYKGQSESMHDVNAPNGVSASAKKSNANRRLDLVA